MEFVLIYKYIIPILLVVNFVKYTEQTWIIEQIPQRRYSPKAFALSGKLLLKSLSSHPVQPRKNKIVSPMDNSKNSFRTLKTRKRSKPKEEDDMQATGIYE